MEEIEKIKYLIHNGCIGSPKGIVREYLIEVFVAPYFNDNELIQYMENNGVKITYLPKGNNITEYGGICFLLNEK